MTSTRSSDVIASLVHKHKGRPGFAAGGAPSLLEDLKRAPAGSIFVSANAHGCRATRCDYIACCDNIEPRLRALGLPIISKKAWADYRVFTDPPLPNSGMLAAWSLWVMGCAPILLGGCELYTGATYFDDPTFGSTGRFIPLQKHLDNWAQLQRAAPGGTFRALSGPLLELFPPYDPDEPAHEIIDCETVKQLVARPCTVPA